MVKARKNNSSFLYEPRVQLPELPKIGLHDAPEQSLYHLFDTTKESIFGINFAKNCPLQPNHPASNINFQTLAYSLPREIEPKVEWELKFCKERPSAILIGHNSEPFAPFEKTRSLALGLGKFLVNQGFKIWFQTRSSLDLELFETLLYLEEKVQLLLPFHTLSDRIAKLIEPFSPSPISRLKQLETLKNLNISFEVCLDSLIPGVNDSKANLWPLLEALADKGVKRTTISYMNFESIMPTHQIKNNKVFSPYTTCTEFEFAGVGARKVINANYRKAKYVEIMAWGKQVGIQIAVDSIFNPDLARKSSTHIQNITSNLKARYLALTPN